MLVSVVLYWCRRGWGNQETEAEGSYWCDI